MAGAGYKLFNTGDVLTAAQVNTYLQEQAVMRFANAAARTTALSGVLAEGMVSYLMDTDSVEVYNGTSWVGVASGDITSVTAGTGLTGGGTSGSVTLTNDMATTITAAGDIVVGTGSGTYDNLPIGTTGQVLTADTTVSPYKVKWSAPASSGGITLISSTSVGTGTTVTFSNIFATSYKQLYLVGKNIYANGDNRTMSFAPLTSGDSVCDFNGIDIYYEGSGSGTASSNAFYGGSAEIFTKLPSSTGSPDTSLNFQMLIYAADLGSTMVGYNFQSITQYSNTIGHNIVGKIMSGASNAAINKLRFSTNGGNFASGTIYLYGIN